MQGNSSNSYRYGKYINKIEFSKTELEAVTSKSIAMSTTAGSGSFVYAQAYVEFADGTRKNISNDWSGGGIYSSTNYWDDNIGESVYYARFNY